MQQQRKVARRHLAIYPEVVERESGVVLGRLADLTATGLMVVSDEPIEAGSVYQLSIALPQPLEGRSSIDLEARSLWTRTGANARLHETGFELTRLADQDRRNVSRLILTFGLKD